MRWHPATRLTRLTRAGRPAQPAQTAALAVARRLAAGIALVALALPPAAGGRALGAAAQSVLSRHPPDVVEELFEDKVVLLSPGGSAYVEALVIFEQPRRRALGLLAQTERHGEFRPELEQVQTIRSGRREAVDAHRLRVVFTTIEYRLRSRFDWRRARISWELDPDFDNGVRALEGYWEMHELDDRRTLALFGSRVDVGPALPLWLQEAVTRKNVPEAVERVRLWVDSDGTYRP